MRLVIVESPYAGDVERNVAYARAAMRDCLMRGEAPFASHLLYTQPGVLDDNIPIERGLGITAGLLWGDKADATVVYVGFGISLGMLTGIAVARLAGRPVEFRGVGLADDPEQEAELAALWQKGCGPYWPSLRRAAVQRGLSHEEFKALYLQAWPASAPRQSP